MPRINRAASPAVDPRDSLADSVGNRLKEWSQQNSEPDRPVSATRFFSRLFPEIASSLAPATLRDIYAGVRGRLPEEVRARLDEARRRWTGLEPGKGGHVGVDVGEVLRRAGRLARQVADYRRSPLTTVGFQRQALGVDATVTDDQVRHRFSALLLDLPQGDRSRLELAQTQAVGKPKKTPTQFYDLEAMLNRACDVARDVTSRGQPVSLLEFYQRALGYDTPRFNTLKVRASQYSGRLSPDQKKEFEEAKAVATGKQKMTAAGEGQVFAPNADQMDEQRATLAPRPGGFDAVTITVEPLVTPADGPGLDTDLPGIPLPEDPISTTEKILMLPADEWERLKLPPTTTRPHWTPLPRIALDPTTIGILIVAGILVAIDGPLPLGDVVAAALLRGRLGAN